MKLFYSATSPYVRKVMVTAREREIVHRLELVPATVVPTKGNDDVATANPLMKVPTLVTEDGLALFDSRVIAEYLDAVAPGGPKLFPPVGRDRWEAIQLQSLADGITDAAVLTRYETWLRPESLRWTEWVEGQLRKVRQGVGELAKAVAGLPATPTIGSVAAGCALAYLDFRFSDIDWRADHPALADWYAGFAKRPSMLATIPPAS